jgi:hypothetical protein
VLSSLWFSMMRISVIRRNGLATNFEPGSCHFGDRTIDVRDPDDARQHEL